MKNSSKIYELLDGSLPETEKVELFKELANNKDLREEFNYASSLNKTITENRDLFAVPAGSKSAVFGTIGLELEGATSSIFASKLFVGAVSSIVTFILLTSIYFLTSSNEVISQNQDDTYTKLTTNIQLPEENVNYANDISEVKNNVNFSKNYSSIEKSDDNIADNEEFNKNSELFMEEKEYTFLSKSEIALNSNISLSKINNYSGISKLNEISIFEKKLTKSNFYLEWNSTVNQNFPKETISPSDLQVFNNNNLALFYQFNKNLDFGVEVRQENFFQVYEDAIKIYEQTPNFTTYSLAMKYSFLRGKLIQNLSNYLKLQGGINQGGFVSRGALGFYYEIYDGFGINANIEYSNLYFRNDFDKFNSHKLSLNYGIKYDF